MIVSSKLTPVNLQDISLPDYILSHIDQYGDLPALVEGETGRTISYRQFKILVRRVASALTRLGFKKGDVFCIYSHNVPEFAILFFGVLSVGGIITTANPTYTTGELVPQLRHTSAKYIITTEQSAEKAKAAAAQCANVRCVYVFGHHPGCHPFSDLTSDDGSAFPKFVDIKPKEDIAVLPFSSGTTGLPKAVMLTHFNLVSNIIQTSHQALYKPLQPGKDVFIGVVPFYHSFGFTMVLGWGIFAGVKIVTVKYFKPDSYFSLAEEYKATFLHCVPPIIVILAKSPLVDKYDLSSVQEIACGAAPLGRDTEEEVMIRLNTKLGQGYGLTETSPIVLAPPRFERRTGSSGVLIPNTECKVVDLETGAPLGANKDGELWFRGPQIMKGYLNNPDATNNCIDNEGWFHTGDIGHYDEEGYFYIVDRLKELIKYKGFQVAPAELEGTLLSHNSIADAAVIGVPDLQAGELPKAFVVLKPNMALTKDEIMKFVEGRLSRHKHLRGGVEFIDQIPKSLSGKILRRQLRQRVKSKL